jgi:AraC-like DNA-binding protein
VVSIPEPTYQEIIRGQVGDESINRWDDAYVWTEQKGFINYLRGLCHRFSKGDVLAERALVYSLIGSLIHSDMNDSIHNSRFEIVLKAANYLKSKEFDVSSVEELVTSIGCSERSLQYAFNAVYGISPMTYVKRSRLNLVYNQLIRQPDTPIAYAANIYGFWHMGQFARDFRNVYGMLPSQLKNHIPRLKYS